MQVAENDLSPAVHEEAPLVDEAVAEDVDGVAAPGHQGDGVVGEQPLLPGRAQPPHRALDDGEVEEADAERGAGVAHQVGDTEAEQPGEDRQQHRAPLLGEKVAVEAVRQLTHPAERRSHAPCGHPPERLRDDGEQRDDCAQDRELDRHHPRAARLPEQQRHHRPAGPLGTHVGRPEQEGQRGHADGHRQGAQRQVLCQHERLLGQELIRVEVRDPARRPAEILLRHPRRAVRVVQALLAEAVLLLDDPLHLLPRLDQRRGRRLAVRGGRRQADDQQVEPGGEQEQHPDEAPRGEAAQLGPRERAAGRVGDVGHRCGRRGGWRGGRSGEVGHEASLVSSRNTLSRSAATGDSSVR